jgi:signal transduction histidine kinase
MLALAFVFFSFAVYGGVRAYLTNSLEKDLSHTAETIVTDYLIPLQSKGNTWFLSEMTESYPPGISDPFIRVVQNGRILYESGDLRDPLVRFSKLPLPRDASQVNTFQRATAESGQPLMIFVQSYSPPYGAPIVIETASNMEPLNHLLESLFMILLIATPAIIIGAAVGGHLLMAGPLRPVVVLTEQAERIGRKALGERLSIIRSGDELERLSLALNRMIDRLEEALAHNQRFSADASHELRTPLTIIRGELEALIDIPELPEQATGGITSALDEIDRMSRIVDNLMTISRLDSGGERMEMTPIELTTILKTTLDHMSLLAEEKNIALTCEADAPVWVMGDAMRVKQVIVNLVDNAIKYTLDAGRVLVRLEALGQEAVLTVVDTGIGIPAESLPHVFDRFYRTDKARSRVFGGTGLGLAIVKAICSAHNGTLSIESTENKGTTLRVYLPLLILSPAEIAQLKSRQTSPVTLTRGEPSAVSAAKV